MPLAQDSRPEDYSQLDNLFFALASPLSSSPKLPITESMDEERTRRKPIYLRSIDVHTRRQINIDSDCARQVELTVQCASPMSTRHSSRRSELIHISSAACWTVVILLDAVASCFDEWEGEVYFGYYACDVEAGGVADTGFVDGFESGADGR